MELDEALVRAEKARQILSDPMIQEALSALEAATINKLKVTQEDKARLRLVDFLHAADLFKQYFVSQIETGKIAADQSRWQQMKEKIGL